MFGRDARMEGYPLKISEMLALLDGAGHLAKKLSQKDPTELGPEQKRRLKAAIAKVCELFTTYAETVR